MNEGQLKQRTKDFAIKVLNFVEALPRSRSFEHVGKQLLRCGTSVGANYRASCRAKSQADFIAKLSIVEEGADEVMFWLEILTDSNLYAENLHREEVVWLYNEANELISIVVASIKTARLNQSKIANPNSKILRGVTQAAKGDRL